MARKLSVNGLDKAIRTTSVVYYYAPWCGYCQRFNAEFERLTNLARTHMPHVHVVRFNMDKHNADVRARGIGKDVFGSPVADDVSGFPTVMFYGNSSTDRTVYEGERKAEALLATMKAYYA